MIAKYWCKITVYYSPLNSFFPVFDIQNYIMNHSFCSEHMEGNALNKNITRIFSHHWEMHLIFSRFLTKYYLSTHFWLSGSLIPILAQTQTVMTHFFLLFCNLHDKPWKCILNCAFRFFRFNPPT